MGSSDLHLTGELPPAESWTPSPQQVRSLVVSYYRSKRYYDQSTAQNIAVLKVASDPVYECVLETLMEHRAFEERLEPYDGSPIEKKSVLPLWDAPVKLPEGFKESTETVRIPGTEKVRKCSTCKHQGRVTCSGCNGAGRLRCQRCGGTGKKCTCDGGYNNCQACNGRRELECPVCRGFGEVASYTAVVAKFSAGRDRKANKEIPASYKHDVSKLTLETVGRTLHVEDLSSLPPSAKELAQDLVARVPTLPTEPTNSSDRVLRRQRIVVSLLKNVAVRYRLDGTVGDFSVVGSSSKLEGLPVRRNYMKIGRHVAFAVGGIVFLLVGLLLYQRYSRESQYQQAVQLLDQGAPAKALVMFEELSTVAFKDSPQKAKQASFELGVLHLENKDYPESIKLLTPLKAESWPGSEQALLRARYEEALAYADDFLKQGSLAGAIRHLETAQSIKPTPETEQELSQARKRQVAAAAEKYRGGLRLMRQRKYAQAIALFDTALVIYPDYKLAVSKRVEAQTQLYKAKQKDQQLARIRQQNAKNFLEIVTWSWEVSEFSVATLNVQLKNKSPFDIKDVQFEMDYKASSGTSLGSGRETAYLTVRAGKTRWVKLTEFADRRAKRASIVIRDARWTWEPSKRNLDW